MNTTNSFKITKLFLVNCQKIVFDKWSWLTILFAVGCIFFIKNQQVFVDNFLILSIFFTSAILLFFITKNHHQNFYYLAILIFLSGGFYSFFYQKFFLNYTKFEKKTYLKTTGKIIALKKFYNPINQHYGLSLLVSEPSFKIDNSFTKNKIKKNKSSKKTQKNYKKKYKKKSHKSSKKTSKKKSKTKKIKNFKNLVNLYGFQDIDRQFLDYKNSFGNYHFKKINNDLFLARPPPLVLVNAQSNFENIKLHDKVEFMAMFNGFKIKDFADDFDLAIDADAKKIGGFGYAIGEVKILESFSSPQFEDYFRELSAKIKNKILANMSDDIAGIAIALLVGEQNFISPAILEKIRQCGLAHLLSISGFHMTLAGLSFVIFIRYFLNFFPIIALNFDVKKISAVFALVACFFYLKISNSSLPAKRAFLMVGIMMLSYFINQKFNSKRAVMIALAGLLILNPWIIFNISFQLSFIAILVLVYFYQNYSLTNKINNRANNHAINKKIFLYKIFNHLQIIFLQIKNIFFISILIQIATTPFLMNSFHNFSLISPITNIFAIPLASLIIMPSGFLALLLMPINLEKIPLKIMAIALDFLQQIIVFFSNISFANFTTSHLSIVALGLSAVAIIIFCLQQDFFCRILAIMLFIFSFFIDNFFDKPALIFSQNQKFFAIYNESSELLFSSGKKPNKQQKNWLVHFNEKKFKTIKNCDNSKGLNNFCFICTKNHINYYCQTIYNNFKILTIHNRSAIKNLCAIKSDLVVNLTSKYQLPDCFKKSHYPPPVIIDNFDFLNNKTHLIYLKKDKILINTAQDF